MRCAAIVVVLLMAVAALAAPTILRTYDWNGHRYSNILLDDGTRVEIKGGPADLPAAFLAKAKVVSAQSAALAVFGGPVVTPVKEKTLADFTDEELIAEVRKRPKIDAKALGFEVTK